MTIYVNVLYPECFPSKKILLCVIQTRSALHVHVIKLASINDAFIIDA